MSNERQTLHHSVMGTEIRWRDDVARLVGVSNRALSSALASHRHSGFRKSASFSPDGARIVTTGHRDSTARLWDAAAGREIETLSGHAGSVTSATFSPCGAHIVTTSRDGTARVWDAATGREIATLSGHPGSIESASFSSDGARIITTGHRDGTARVWDAATGRDIATLRGHLRHVDSASFSPDGARIVTTSRDGGYRRYGRDGTVRVWDAATGRQIATFSGHAGYIKSASFSSDGAHIVTTSVRDSAARLWDAATGREIITLSGHPGSIESASFSPDGAHIVTTSAGDNAARLWDAATGREIATLGGHSGYMESASFSPDGARIVTKAYGDSARLWDAATGREIATLSGHAGYIKNVSFSPDGARIVTTSRYSTARVWDAATGREIATLSGHVGYIESASFSPDGAHIVTTSAVDDVARLWDAATGRETATLGINLEKYDSSESRSDDGRTFYVDTPGSEVGPLQVALATILESETDRSFLAETFQSSTSYSAALSLHEGLRSIVEYEIEEFYSRISFGMVRKLFLFPPFSTGPDAATALAQLCTYRNALPSGATTSRIIADRIVSRFDKCMLELASQHGLCYSRHDGRMLFSTTCPDFPADMVCPVEPDSAGARMLTGSALIKAARQNGLVLETFCRPVQPVGASDGS